MLLCCLVGPVRPVSLRRGQFRVCLPSTLLHPRWEHSSPLRVVAKSTLSPWALMEWRVHLELFSFWANLLLVFPAPGRPSGEPEFSSLLLSWGQAACPECLLVKGRSSASGMSKVRSLKTTSLLLHPLHGPSTFVKVCDFDRPAARPLRFPMI